MPLEGAPSDDLLSSLHQSLGEAMQDPEHGNDFVRITRALREKRYARGETEIREIAVDGRLKFRVDVGDRLGADVYFGSYRELFDLEAFCRTLAPGDTVVDVGANFGFLSITAADRVGPRGHIVAFEPDSHAHALLTENVKLNRLGRRIRVVQRCVSNEDGMVQFHSMKESAFSGMADTKRSVAKEVVMVQAQRLDTAAVELRLRRIDALKIDVEGFEFAVLEGGAQILGRSPDPIVMFEVSRKNLDATRRGNFQGVLGGLLTSGWDAWFYEIERDELVRAPSAESLIEGDVGNVFLAKSGSDRLNRLRTAYREIVATKLLPAAVRRWTGTTALDDGTAQPPHALQKMLWNSFLHELSARLQQDRARALDESGKLRVQVDTIESALKYERSQREAAQQRAEQAAAEAARAGEQVGRAQLEMRQAVAAHEAARTALAALTREFEQHRAGWDQNQLHRHEATVAGLQREIEVARKQAASLEHDIHELHVIITQRDAARIKAEEDSAAARSELERVREILKQSNDAANSRIVEQRALEAAKAELDTARALSVKLEHDVRDLHKIIEQRDAARIKAEEQLASARATFEQMREAARESEAEAAAVRSEERRAMKTALSNAQAELISVREQREKLERDLQHIIDQNDASRTKALEQLSDSRAQIQKLESDVRDLHLIIEQRDAARIRAEEQLVAARATFEQTREAHEQAEAMAAAVRDEERRTLETALAGARTELESARDHLDKRESDVRDLHRIIEQRDAARGRAEEQLALARAELEQALLSGHQQREVEQARAATLELEIAKLRALLAQSEATQADDTRVFDETCQQLRSELEEADTTIAERENEINNLKSALDERVRALRALDDARRTLATELSQLRESAAKAERNASERQEADRQALESSRDEISALQARVGQLEMELRTSRAESKSTSEKLVHIRALHDQTLAAQQNVVRELNATIERLDGEVRQHRQTEQILVSQGNDLRALSERLDGELKSERALFVELRERDERTRAEAAATAAAEISRTKAELNAAVDKLREAAKREAALRDNNAALERSRDELQRTLDSTLARKMRRWIGRPAG